MPVTPGAAEPRFPGFDVLGQASSWDRTTARVVLARLRKPAPPSFFSDAEERTARALCDRLVAQDDEPRVPVFETIDERLFAGRGDGYRYVDMPGDALAWRRSIAGLDADARDRGGVAFWQLEPEAQREVIEAVRTAEGDWSEMPAKRVFGLWIRYACTAYYAHPWAWNEIGFSGPAYPRGYKNLGLERREHFEVPEHDARDPVAWGERVEAAHRRHGLGTARSAAASIPSTAGSTRPQ